MAWVALEKDLIVHVLSNNRIIMESYKIAWNNDSLKDCIIIREGDIVYDSENENDFRKLKEEVRNFGKMEAYFGDSVFVPLRKRYVVKADNKETTSRLWNLWKVSDYDESIVQYDNLTTYHVIMSRGGYYYDDGCYNSHNRLLFVSTDVETFEKAKQALQYGLRAIRLDELNGMPSDCDPEIFQLLKTKM